ncbi:hypothetical protein ABZP36_034553 [Zizania latifolia]
MDAASSPPSPPPLRLVIIPWLAFGHLLPYLELAERLASRGHRVSLVSTPRNVARLPPVRRVDLVAVPLPRVDGLPDGAESTNDVPRDKVGFLWKAFDLLGEPFGKLLAAMCADDGTRPDWIIADSFHHWAAAAALQHKVPCALLLPSASVMAAWPSVALSDNALLTAPVERPVTMPDYEWEKIKAGYLNRNRDGVVSEMTTAKRCSLARERCTLAAMRSCPEWELDTFWQVAASFGKPVVPLGLLPPSPDGARRRAANGNTDGGEEDSSSPAAADDDATLRWLDAQPPNSVLYVALGSEVPLTVEQVHELALGLELAGTRFLWALRKPTGAAAVPDDDDDILPPRFQDRTRGRGVVAMGWVPQLAILSHAAVGGFLTHCGRNSLIEGLLFGKPLVMLPIFGDQGPNSRLMEGRKVGLQVARDKDGSFDRHGVAAAVRAVMVDEEARSVFVANALKLQDIVADKELHERYIDEFLDKLRSYTATA